MELENKHDCQGSEGGRDSRGVWDQRVPTAVLKMQSQQGPALQQRELGSMLRGSLEERGVQGRTDTYMCLSPRAGHLKLSQHCWLHKLYSNIKLKVYKKDYLVRK